MIKKNIHDAILQISQGIPFGFKQSLLMSDRLG